MQNALQKAVVQSFDGPCTSNRQKEVAQDVECT